MQSVDSGVPVYAGHRDAAGLRLGRGVPAVLYASPSLQLLAPVQAQSIAQDFQINDTPYRRLDPEYYAWLRSKMHLARMAAAAGQLVAQEYDVLRGRFNQMHEWAVAHFGAPALEEALRTVDSRHYNPPRAEMNRATRGWGIECGPLPDSLALVAAIREQARELGWSEASLFAVTNAHHGEIGAGSGLVCYLRFGDRIGEVRREAIEIILRSGARQHFYNPDVEQPWLRRVAEPKRSGPDF